MSIHKEGRLFLLILFAILLLINIGLHRADIPIPLLRLSYFVCVVIFLMVLQFFRSPMIQINENPKHILAPADGKVVVIEETEESEFFLDRRIQISIFMSPTNVHINRNPVAGVIKYFRYHKGKYLVAWHPKASTENERTTIVYQMNNGIQILARQIAGAVARRIKWYVCESERVKQGEEFGFIKFGSRVDVFLPLDAKIKVGIDQKTKGGITVLAELS